MADEYFYARNQEKRGPFSAAELKKLAATGQLLPTDLVWKRGTPKWLLASSIKGLLPTSPAPDAPMPEMPAQLPAVNLDTDRAPRPRAPTASVAKRHALTAGKIAALSAERTKIANVNLPLAFTRLGNHCYAHRLHANAFAALFSELDDLSARITATKSGKTLAPTATFVEKAKALADKGLQAATAQKLLLLQKSAFARLGRAAYEQQGSAAGPEDLVGPIASLTARLAEVNQALREKVQSAGGTRKVLTIAGGVATALLVVVGVFLSNRLSLSAFTGSANAWKVSSDGGSSRSSKGPTADAKSGDKPSRAPTRAKSTNKASRAATATQTESESYREGFKMGQQRWEEEFRTADAARASIANMEEQIEWGKDSKDPETQKTRDYLRGQVAALKAALNEGSRPAGKGSPHYQSGWNKGVEVGQHWAAQVDAAIARSQPPQLVAALVNAVREVERNYSEMLERISAAVEQARQSGRSAPDLERSLDFATGQYEGFMSVAGKYL